jgi:hypothetical protein
VQPGPSQQRGAASADVELWLRAWRDLWRLPSAATDSPKPASNAPAVDTVLSAIGATLASGQRDILSQLLTACAAYLQAAPALAGLAGGSGAFEPVLAAHRASLRHWFGLALAAIVQPRSVAMGSSVAAGWTELAGSAKASRRLVRAGLGLGRSLGACAREAVLRFESEPAPAAAVESAQQRHARWLASCDAAYSVMLRDPRYTRRFGRFINALLPVIGRIRHAADSIAPLLGLPTRAEFDALAARLQEQRNGARTGAESGDMAGTSRRRKAPRSKRKGAARRDASATRRRRSPGPPG